MNDYQFELTVLILSILASIALFAWKWYRLPKWVWFGLESAYGWLRTVVAQRRKYKP